MNKKELLDYLSEKIRITAPVASAQENVNQAEWNYDKACGKYRKGIIVMALFAVFFLFYTASDARLFYIDEETGVLQAGGPGGLFLFGGICIFLICWRQTRHIKPAEAWLDQANYILQQEINNPAYRAAAKNFPEKFYNYYDTCYLWNIINEERAENLKEAYNLLEMQKYQQNQIEIQEDIRRMQQQIAASSQAAANASKVTAAASVITAYNTAKRK